MNARSTSAALVLAAAIFLPSFAFAQPPGPPGTPSASVAGNTVTLSWSAPTSGGTPTHYLIIAGTSSGSSDLGTHNVGPVTSVSASVPPGTYFVRVVAANGPSQSPPSGETSFTVAGLSPPGPTNAPTASVAGNTVTLSWNLPTTGGPASHYIILAGVTPGGSELGAFNVGGATSVSAPLPAGTYYVRIVAGNAAGQSAPSPETSFTVAGPQVPGPPGTPTATVVGQTVTVSWSAPTTGGAPTHYLIVAGTSSGASNLGVFNVGATNSVTATLGGGTYFIRVVAGNAVGNGPPSAETSFVIPGSAGTIEGTWQGTTSQGVAFAFTVSGGQVTMINAGGVFNNGCTASAQENVTVPITGNQFAHNRATTPGSIGWSIQGTLTSTTTASGSITLTASPSGSFTCEGTVTATWTATNFGIGAPLLPLAPAGFAATVDGTAVTFTWTAPPPSPPVTAYQLEIGTSAGASNIGVFILGAPATSHTRTLGAGTYFARVRARNQSGAGPASAEVTFTIAAIQPPGAPSNVAASVSGSTVTVSWFPPTTGGTPASYDVEIGTTSGGSEIGVFNTSSTSLSRSLNGGTYFVRVRARNAAGASAASNEVTFSISAALPGTPTALQAAVSGSTATLSWSAPASGSAVSSYDIELGTSSGASDVAVINTTNTNTTFNTGALAAGTYFARVRARNSAGTGPPSNEISFTIGTAGVVPRAPAGFSVAVDGSTANFSWASPLASDPQVTSYDLEIGTSAGATNVGVFNIPGPATSYSRTGLSAGTYFARLRARNASGVGPASTERSFTIVAGEVPGVPTDLAASVSDTSVTLTWAAPITGGTPTSYLVEIGTATGESNIGTFTAGAGPRSYSRVLANGTYFARVRGRNAAGDGPPSNEIVFTVGPPAPGVPTNVVVGIDVGNVTIAWTAPTTGTTPISYDVLIGTTFGSSNTGTFTVTSTSHTMNLSAGTYFARVRARDASGAGPASHEIAFEVGAPVVNGWQMYGRNAAHQGRASVNGPTDNDVAWTVALPASFEATNGPVVGPDGTVYLTSATEFLAVTSTGTVRCRRSMVGASTPALSPSGAAVYVASASEVQALNPATCATQWSLPIGTAHASPTVGRDGTIYVASAFDDPNRVYALNGNGTIRWSWSSESSTCGFETSPAIGPNGDIYVHHTCLGVIALDENGVEQWRRSGPGDARNSPSVGPNGTIYIADSPGFFALNLNGTVRWSIAALSTSMQHAAAAVSADGRSIYRGDNNGFFYALDSSGTIRWTFDTGRRGPITGAPAIAANGLVYVTQAATSTTGFIYAVRETDGGLVWQRAIGASGVSPAIGPDGTVYVAGSTGATNGTLYAFRP